MSRKVILYFSLVLFCATSSLAPIFSTDKYIQITGEKVNIRFKNDVNSTLVAKAKKGDIFELISEKGNWFEINMFSGEYRYIHKSLGKVVTYIPKLTQSESTRRAIFSEISKVEEKSYNEAYEKYPNDVYKNIDYMRILDDLYKLDIFHRYGVQVPIYRKLLVEGVKKEESK